MQLLPSLVENFPFGFRSMVRWAPSRDAISTARKIEEFGARQRRLRLIPNCCPISLHTSKITSKSSCCGLWGPESGLPQWPQWDTTNVQSYDSQIAQIDYASFALSSPQVLCDLTNQREARIILIPHRGNERLGNWHAHSLHCLYKRCGMFVREHARAQNASIALHIYSCGREQHFLVN